MPGRSSRRLSPATMLSFALLAFAVGCLAVVLVQRGAVGAADPWHGRSLYLYPDSPAALALTNAAAQETSAFTTIADTPSAVWVEPEEHGVDEVDEFVHDIAESAQADSEIAVFVVYGIPDRDCGNQSSGGVSDDEYPSWVSAIADGLEKTGSVVILEPDSLALASECGNLDERIPQISAAIDALQASEATIYLDGGHSDWLPASTMSDILHRAGVDRVRGFASNVSNYNSTSDEMAYADQLSGMTGRSHFVIDVSRNGNGSNGQWCNPKGRKLGAQPSITPDDGPLDAELWIKNPGESDGTCGGGPAAGQWWTRAAVDLATGR